ncbi:MAG: hypothetical protein CBC13_07220 [Planctomycetia bacterium TMED53]|nr:MAG: hypothetical protein CBC13_07220 [Planctomycetia bacterium TMED53]
MQKTTIDFKSISIKCIFVAAFLINSERTAISNDDPWLLFRHASSVVAGEVTEVLQEERDLLYHLTDLTPGNLETGSSVHWWREPEGAGTEGIGAQTGTRGAWFVATDSDELFPIHVATLLPRGFLPMSDFSQIGDLQKLLLPQPHPEAALRLLQSPDSEVRRVAIGWWNRSDLQITAEQQSILEENFSGEADPGCQRSYLSLYLQRGWTYGGAGISELIPHSPDGTVSWLTLRYLEKKGDSRQRARLISSWLVSDAAGKAKLALAFRDLKMREAHPWLIREISQSAGQLKFICIEALAATGTEKTESTLTSLLNSNCHKTRLAVLKGLAKSSSSRGYQILNSKTLQMDPTDPLLNAAESLRKNPRKNPARSGE